MKLIIRRITFWDQRIFIRIAGREEALSTSRFFTWITRSADGYYYPLVPAALWLGGYSEIYSFLMTGLLAFAVELPLFRLMKSSVKRLRPFEQLHGVRQRVRPPDRFSFPSGHTAAAVIMTGLLGFHFPLLILPLAIWAVLVGWSRVYLSVHYPTDVLAGALLGGLSLLVGVLGAG